MFKKILAAMLSAMLALGITATNTVFAVDFTGNTGCVQMFSADLGSGGGGGGGGSYWEPTEWTQTKSNAISTHNETLQNELDDQYKNIIQTSTRISETVYEPVLTPGSQVMPSYVVSSIDVPYETLTKFIRTGYYGTDDVSQAIRSPSEFTGQAATVWNTGTVVRQPGDYSDILENYGFIGVATEEEPVITEHPVWVSTLPSSLSGLSTVVYIPDPDSFSSLSRMSMQDPFVLGTGGQNRRYYNGDTRVPSTNYSVGTPNLNNNLRRNNRINDVVPGHVWQVTPDGEPLTTEWNNGGNPHRYLLDSIPVGEDPEVVLLWDNETRYPSVTWRFSDGRSISDLDRDGVVWVGTQDWIDQFVDAGYNPSEIISDRSQIRKVYNFVEMLKNTGYRTQTTFTTTDGFVDGGKIDNQMKTRYKTLNDWVEIMDQFRVHNNTDKLKTYRVLQYRITGYEQNHVMHSEPGNRFLWTVHRGASLMLQRDQSSSNLSVLFNESGTYNINVQREYTDTHSEYGKYVVDEYWILADTGQLLYRNTYEENEVNFNPDATLTSSRWVANKNWTGLINAIRNDIYTWLNTGDPVTITPQTYRIA